jgi:hypothetical protein
MDRAALIRNLLLALAALGAALPAAAQTPRSEVSGGEASGTDIALQAGGGMQLRLTDRFGVRVGRGLSAHSRGRGRRECLSVCRGRCAHTLISQMCRRPVA